jgi:CheY-like chemotaxis protein
MRINTLNIIGKEFKVSRRIMVCDDEPFNVQGLIIVLKAVVKKMGVSEKLVDELVDKCYNGK